MLKEIQSLTGLLNFACSMVKPGMANYYIRLNQTVKSDLKLWL